MNKTRHDDDDRTKDKKKKYKPQKLSKQELDKLWYQKITKLKNEELNDWFQGNLKQVTLEQLDPIKAIAIKKLNFRKPPKEEMKFIEAYGVQRGEEKKMVADFDRFA